MEKIKKRYFHLFLLLLFSLCVTTKSNGEPPILNNANQKFSVLRMNHEPIKKFKNEQNPSIKDHLKKLKNPKLIFEVGTFIAGTATALTASVAIHAWGHTKVLNYFYPNSTKIVKIRPWNVSIDFDSQQDFCES